MVFLHAILTDRLTRYGRYGFAMMQNKHTKTRSPALLGSSTSPSALLPTTRSQQKTDTLSHPPTKTHVLPTMYCISPRTPREAINPRSLFSPRRSKKRLREKRAHHGQPENGCITHAQRVLIPEKQCGRRPKRNRSLPKLTAIHLAPPPACDGKLHYRPRGSKPASHQKSIAPRVWDCMQARRHGIKLSSDYALMTNFRRNGDRCPVVTTCPVKFNPLEKHKMLYEPGP
ncbi:hypothetical protein BaRGS_00022606 [Batillaria attramentaria]|uniref:Uncharacterized protein n=1 Tax=Batillaria attramentaria TaxID=370345 RepID=A0ABD0KGL8_9CAEN